MRVLTIIGSPRKGNTLRLAQRFEAALKALGDVETEQVFLRDVHLELCRGCGACLTLGEGHCPLHRATKRSHTGFGNLGQTAQTWGF